MRAAAPAKLNLYLHITGKRADGYHDLESLVVFTGLADMLTVQPGEGLSIAVSGPFADAAGADHDNLVLRAARLLQQVSGTQQGAAFTLEKNIPAGAGLGGGSSDAATALRLLNALWALGMTDAQLHVLATQLGADVAMFLQAPRPLLARGTGTELTPLATPLPPLHAVLVYPHTPLLTAAVYGRMSAPVPRPSWNDALEPLAQLAVMHNDLQRPAISLLPEVAEILLAFETALPTPLLARMTGSGACCFALYATAEEAARSADAIQRAHPHWWVASTKLS